LRRLTKKGDIPSINTLVDICNLVSIRYAIAVAAFDTSALQGAVTVRFADGSERYTPLGVSEVETPEPGEVIFADDSGLVIARRWCWRQSDESASRENTQNVIITVEAQHTNCRPDVEAALVDVLELLNAHVAGSFYDDLLGPDNPKISN
jgi:DNA/RNA-binding domain of Phe-tRNA-synthetase-like protein